METGVIPILHQADPAQPLLRAGINKAPEKCFEALVHPLRLAIGLRVVGRAHAELSTCQAKQLLPEMAGEDAIAVGDDVGWHAMQAVNMVKEDLSHLLSCERVKERNKVSKLAELVDDNHDAISCS